MQGDKFVHPQRKLKVRIEANESFIIDIDITVTIIIRVVNIKVLNQLINHTEHTRNKALHQSEAMVTDISMKI